MYINATNNVNINVNNNASINATNNAAIDIMKFICAILIVSIHTSPLLEINRLWSLGITIYIARIAVPFFFVTSGYFFAKKIMTTNGSSRVLPDYLLKLFKLYVGWSLVYFPLYIYYAGLFKSDTLKKSLIYLKNFIFSASYFHLWYMPALFLSICLLYFVYKKNMLRTALIISFLLFLIGLLDDSYYGFVSNIQWINETLTLYNKHFITTRNGLFFGALFVFIGGYIAINPLKFCKKWSLVGVIISAGLLFVEVAALKKFDIAKDYNMFIMLIPLEVFLFQSLLISNVKIHPSISKGLRNYSMNLYFVHPLCLYILLDVFADTQLKKQRTLLFIVTIVSSLVVIFIYRFIIGRIDSIIRSQKKVKS